MCGVCSLNKMECPLQRWTVKCSATVVGSLHAQVSKEKNNTRD